MIKKQPEDLSYQQKTADPMIYGSLREYADNNRKNPTEAEYQLWQCLRRKALGVKFRRQHAIEDFIADFVCIEEQLVIEVDGGYHNDVQQQEDDERRTSILNARGYRVLRFKNEEILFDIENVLTKIREHIKFTTITEQ